MDNESTKTPTSRSASDLEGIARGRLQGQVRAFQIIAESRGLILRGRARTYYAKQLAQHFVMESSPMPILANDIEVVKGGEL